MFLRFFFLKIYYFFLDKLVLLGQLLDTNSTFYIRKSLMLNDLRLADPEGVEGL